MTPVGNSLRVAAARTSVATARALLVAAALLLLSVSAASAENPPYGVVAPYSSAPPTKGALASDGQNNRYLLGGTWLERPDTGNVGITNGYWRNTSSTAGWGLVTIPSSYNAGVFTQASMHGYVEWYRRDFTLPATAFAAYVPNAYRSWMLEFESVNYAATVWLNGHQLGTHEGAYLPFEFQLRYLRSGVNRLVVRVDDQRTAADLPPGPNGGWWNFGGILDAVYMIPVQRADLESVAIKSKQTCPTCDATIDEQATVVNLTGKPQRVSLIGKYGAAKLNFGQTTLGPGRTWSPTASVVIHNPQLWAPGSPVLYKATDTLRDKAGRRIGGYTYESGIRTITVTTGGRLELNGRLLDLRGVNLHEQTVASGAALSVAAQAQLIAWVRELGATIIRAHYPLDPEMEQMADQDGVLLWSEIPVYQVGAPYLADPSWRKRALALLASNIAANQNHPAILLWSVGNELPTPPTAGEATYIAAAAAEAKSLDPTRPVGMALSNWPGVACQNAYAPLDVVGINEYFSWFDAGGGTNDDRLSLSPYLDAVHACYPTQALMVTEFGYGGNRNGPLEVRGTYLYQENQLAFSLTVFASKPWLSGALYFPMQDFSVEPGYDGSDPLGTPPYVDKGVLDQYGAAKPSFAEMAQLYGQVQQIAPAP